MQSSAAMQQSYILMAKEIVSTFPMNKAEVEKSAEEKEVEEEVNKEEEEGMQRICTHGPWQLFLSSEQEVGKERGERGGGEGGGGKQGE